MVEVGMIEIAFAVGGFVVGFLMKRSGPRQGDVAGGAIHHGSYVGRDNIETKEAVNTGGQQATGKGGNA